MSESITTPDTVPDGEACPSCNGIGSILMSLCCGRGCATCPGDQAMEAVSCYRCGGTGRLADIDGTALPQLR